MRISRSRSLIRGEGDRILRQQPYPFCYAINDCLEYYTKLMTLMVRVKIALFL
ncbi:MAG: hypothetical protein HC796_12450 [Synechococcaceae cyanobacterium RL_1_2]|nr:hypothetical protein [Synechococcaceae cyanobacterium RL_1_2]